MTVLYKQLQTEREIIINNQNNGPANPYSLIFNLDPTDYPRTGRGDLNRLWAPIEWLPAGATTGHVHESRITLFREVFKRSGSIAQALQMAHHTYITDRYYKFLPYFTDETDIYISYSILAVQPVQHRGFMILMCALTMHLALVLFAIVTRAGIAGRFNAVNQVWQTHVQLFSLANTTAGDILGKPDASTETDSSIEKHMERAGMDRRVFVLRNISQLGEACMAFTEKSDSYDRLMSPTEQSADNRETSEQQGQ